MISIVEVFQNMNLYLCDPFRQIFISFQIEIRERKKRHGYGGHNTSINFVLR